MTPPRAKGDIKGFVPNLGSLIVIVTLLAGAIGTGIMVYIRMGDVAEAAIRAHEAKRLESAHQDSVDRNEHRAGTARVIHAINGVKGDVAAQQRYLKDVRKELKDEHGRMWRAMRRRRTTNGDGQ
jgi:hypothetical protein